MKSRFAGLLRSLWRQGGGAAPQKPTPAPARPAPAAPLAAIKPVAPVAPPPVAAAPAPRPKPIPIATPENVEVSGMLEMPLAIIISALPLDLKAKLVNAPPAGKMVFLPIETVVTQLASGAVKITFGELRQLSPNTFGNTNDVYDSRAVIVPLNEILKRINPSLLARRAAQKVEISEEITGPFGAQARGVSFSAQPMKASGASLPPRSTAPTPPREIQPVASASAQVPPAPRAVTPAAPATPPASTPIAFAPRQNTPLTAPIPFAEPARPNGNGNGKPNNGNGSGNGIPALPPFKFTAAPVPPSATPVAPSAAQPTLAVALRELMENWPDEIKNEIAQNGFAEATVSLPATVVEPGLKRGRVTMAWKEMRALIKPGSPASANDDAALDLPLKVIAPLFMTAQKKLANGRSKVAVSSEIPNLFFGFPQPTPEPVQPVQTTPAPAPRVETSIAFAPKTADTNLFAANDAGVAAADQEFKRSNVPATDFLSRQTQPKEIVTTAMALPGVAGAVVALADGLRVAAEVPAEVNAEAVAAFLPQIFERVNQSTRELRMGALNNVGFTVGNVPWKVFRVNSVYFAAFGRVGEALPKTQLAALAAGLDRKQK